MQKEIIKCIIENNLNPFSSKTNVKNNESSIFKTRDARLIFSKVTDKISNKFIFEDSSNILSVFNFTSNTEELKKRQEFFKTIISKDSSFLKELKSPSPVWSPKYDIVAVTSNEKTFIELKKLGCPVKYITSSEDILDLESRDIVQVVDCEDFDSYLEQLNQTIFINNSDDVYLERYLELLSGWKKNISILDKNDANGEIKSLVEELKPLLDLTSERKSEKITRERVEESLELINNTLSDNMKSLSISGEILFKMLSQGNFPAEVSKILDKAIGESNLPEEIFNKNIPVSINEQELSKVVKLQDSNEFVSISERIKKYSAELKKIPEKIKNLENLLLLFDFYTGIGSFISSINNAQFQDINEKLEIIDSSNLFLNNAQPISFLLDNTSKCSILTGANSGGKTTLLEHIIQLIVLQQIGLPSSGQVSLPIFSEIYYFAKNKGGMGKGAFENLLSQMSKIIPGKQTLILADEIESVTEPGVAGKILSATAEYFINLGCFLVIATHLGQEIKEHLPKLARIDGIEAKGLDENFDLIVSHNPILGRLAHSTPELIIEKMAKSNKNDYLEYLFKNIKNN